MRLDFVREMRIFRTSYEAAPVGRANHTKLDISKGLLPWRNPPPLKSV